VGIDVALVCEEYFVTIVVSVSGPLNVVYRICLKQFVVNV